MNRDSDFGTILCAFFFEKTPTIRLHVHIWDGGPHEPRIRYWGKLLRRGGGAGVGGAIQPDRFPNRDQMPLYIDDYPYSRMNYQGVLTFHFHLGEHGDQAISVKLLCFMVHFIFRSHVYGTECEIYYMQT